MSSITAEYVVNKFLSTVATSAGVVALSNISNPRAVTLASVAAEVTGQAFGLISKQLFDETSVEGYLLSSAVTIGLKTIVGTKIGQQMDNKVRYSKMLAVSLGVSFVSTLGIPSGIGAVINNFNATLPFNQTA